MLTKRVECLLPDLLLLFGGLFLRCLFRLLRFFGHVTLSKCKSVLRTCAVENRRARDQEYMTIVKLILCCSSLCRCERFDQIEPLVESGRAGTLNRLLAMHPECLSI